MLVIFLLVTLVGYTIATEGYAKRPKIPECSIDFSQQQKEAFQRAFDIFAEKDTKEITTMDVGKVYRQAIRLLRKTPNKIAFENLAERGEVYREPLRSLRKTPNKIAFENMINVVGGFRNDINFEEFLNLMCIMDQEIKQNANKQHKPIVESESKNKNEVYDRHPSPADIQSFCKQNIKCSETGSGCKDLSALCKKVLSLLDQNLKPTHATEHLSMSLAMPNIEDMDSIAKI